VLRGFDYGLAAMLGIAIVYGVAWSVVALTWGLIAIGVGGGWLVGVAVREGATRGRRAEAARNGADTIDEEDRPVAAPTRGLSTLGALLGAGAWVAGSYVAFAIIQLIEGSGSLFDPGKLAEFMTASLQVEPTWLQPAVLAGFVVGGWIGARPRHPRPAALAR